MTITIENWFKAVEKRRSRRTFISKAIDSDTIQVLCDVVSDLNKYYDGVRLKIVNIPPDEIITGISGTYGKITGATIYIAVLIEEKNEYLIERGGYIGQAIALEATSHGLSSCWVSGIFDELVTKQIKMKNNECVIAVLPIGYARKNYSLTEKMMSKVGEFQKRKPLDEIVKGLPIEQWPTWIETAINLARQAPSAFNRQPVHYDIDENSITVTLDDLKEETNVPKQLDRGIVMLHIDLAIWHHKIKGEWHYSECKSEVIFKKEEVS